MRKFTITAVVALALGVAAFAPAALAGGSGPSVVVVKAGTCSAHSTSKLKAKLDNGRIETDFEVDQNVVGRNWRVTLYQNGGSVFSGISTTVAPSGSFELRRFLVNAPGTDRIVALGRDLVTGETCIAGLTI